MTWNTRNKSHFKVLECIYTAASEEFPSVFYDHKPVLKIKENYLHQQRKPSGCRIWSRRILVFAEFPALDFVALQMNLQGEGEERKKKKEETLERS